MIGSKSTLPAELLEVLGEYLLQWPGEREAVERVMHFVSRTPVERLYDRSNFDGHITASAFVLRSSQRVAGRDQTSVLLHRHATLGRWLQPGGHVEPGEAIVTTAIRETMEETGVALSVTDALAEPAVSADRATQVRPFHISTFLFPINHKKNEPAHLHFDFAYAFEFREMSKSSAHNVGGGEQTDNLWLPLDELSAIEEFTIIATKLRALILERPNNDHAS